MEERTGAERIRTLIKHELVLLEVRTAALAGRQDAISLRISEFLPGSPAGLIKFATKHRLEGIVGKRKNSRYEPGQRSGARGGGGANLGGCAHQAEVNHIMAKTIPTRIGERCNPVVESRVCRLGRVSGERPNRAGHMDQKSGTLPQPASAGSGSERLCTLL